MNIIITGASRGIGYELVKLFAADSGNKILAISRDEKKLQKLQKECLKMNKKANVFCLAANIGLVDFNRQYFKIIEKEMTSVDILINNAGRIVNKPFMETGLIEFIECFSTNVISVAGLIKYLMPLMGKQTRSHVVNISSMGGVQGSVKFGGLAAYSSSKAALAVLTECLAEEFKDKNISFNCLALGAVQTEMLSKAFPGYKAPVSAKQMAEYIFNFSTTAHHYMNGKIIPVSLSTP